MSSDEHFKRVEIKLLLLYLIDKMELPLSRSQITEFVRESDLMDYYTLQETLAELSESGFLDFTQDNNNTRYTITGEGQTMLEYFERHIPKHVRDIINVYVQDNHRSIKRDYENTATYFPNAENDEFVVKCGVYEDERTLMEISISVDTRDQAKLIQNNWKTNAKNLYGKIIEVLSSKC